MMPAMQRLLLCVPPFLGLYACRSMLISISAMTAPAPPWLLVGNGLSLRVRRAKPDLRIVSPALCTYSWRPSVAPYLTTISYHHVHSHHGEAWNELVDRTAKAAARFSSSDVCGWQPFLQLLRSDLLPWLWFLPASRSSFSLPLLENLCLGTAGSYLGTTQPRTSVVPSPSRSPAAPPWTLRCATFNVCTLRPAEQKKAPPGLYCQGVQHLLLAQCKQHRLSIVGVQETRLPSASAYTSGGFLCFHSAATSEGMEGCAIWIACDLGDGDAHKALSLKNCSVLVSEPRLLCVRLVAEGLSAVVLSAHAPHAKSPADVRDTWWQHLSRVLAAVRKPSDSVILCIDANAKVGRPSSDRVGSFGAEIRTPNGLALETILHEANLFLPSTTAVQSGPSPTWTSPSGHTSRIDFVALSYTLHEFVDSAWTLDLDACLLRPDHKAAVVAFTLPASVDAPPAAEVRTDIDPLQLHDWREAVSALPPQPWNLSVDCHDSALCRDLLGTARRYRAPGRVRAVRPYVSAQSLQYLALRKHLRADISAASALHRRLWLRAVFLCWRCRGDAVAVDVAPLAALDRHIAILLRLFRLAADCVRSQIRGSKKAYIEELGATFAAATTAKDVKALYAALRCLVPSASKRRNTTAGTAVLRPDGQPFADHASRAEGWALYFAGIEGGRPVSWDSLTSKQVDRILEGQAAPPPALHELPTILDWERGCRKIQHGRAAGPDGIHSSLVKSALAPSVKLAFPLALKAAVGQAEPLRWRGGETLPLFKHKGDGRSFDNYRGILLSGLWGKRFHWWIRDSLLPHFTPHAPPLQRGVTGGHGTAHLSLLARTFQGLMRSKNVSHAVVFLDFRQAFYAVFRQFLTRHSHSPEGFLSFCSSMGVPEEHARTILQTLDMPEDAITAGLASHLKRRLGDALHNTWFSVRDATSPIATAKGTRPGDPLADILFALILAPPLKRLNTLLRETGLTPTVTTGGILPGTVVAEAPGPSSSCLSLQSAVRTSSRLVLLLLASLNPVSRPRDWSSTLQLVKQKLWPLRWAPAVGTPCLPSWTLPMFPCLWTLAMPPVSLCVLFLLTGTLVPCSRTTAAFAATLTGGFSQPGKDSLPWPGPSLAVLTLRQKQRRTSSPP